MEIKKKHTKTVLIIGISSFVGSNLAEYLKNDFKVYGTYQKTKVQVDGVTTFPCDVLTKEEVQMAVYAARPDFVIYCAGLATVAECAHTENIAEALNTSGLINAIEYCERYKARICYLSSSYVFGGEKKKYMEMDIPDSLTVYGKTQAASEFYLQKNSLNYIIFRSSLLYGRSLAMNRYTFFEKLQRKAAFNQKFILDNKIKHGFLDVYFLGAVIKLAIEQDFSNRLFQICSSDIMTHYEFAQTYAEVFDEDLGSMVSGKWSFPYIRTEDTDELSEELYFQLDVSNVESFLKVKMPTIKESLEITFKRLNGIKKTKSARSQGSSRITYI
ncbi:MAG: SDR family oxidoreductase [Bacteriovoracaceae bacterium]